MKEEQNKLAEKLSPKFVKQVEKEIARLTKLRDKAKENGDRELHEAGLYNAQIGTLQDQITT